MNADPRDGNARLAPGEAFRSNASGTARKPNDTGPLDFGRIAADALQRVDTVLRHWLPDGKRVGAEWQARNPTRSDATPGSFSVNRVTGRWADFATGDKGGDLVALVAYLDGCDQATAARTLAAFCGSSAAGPARAPKPSKPPPPPAVVPVPDDAPEPPELHPSRRLGKPSAVWTYRDPAGAVLFYVNRFDPPEGRKQVLPLTLRRTAAGLEWQWFGLDAPRPLYRLPELAAVPALPVLIAEGEKAADAAARLLPGWVATTAPNGADGANSADWAPLAGRRCVIWPDADQPGERYALDVKRSAIAAGAASVMVAPLEALALIRGDALPAGFDAADAEALGLDAEALNAWLRDALEAPAGVNAQTCVFPEGAGSPAQTCAADAEEADHAEGDPLEGLPCFRLVECVKGMRPGVYWHGVTRDKETGALSPAAPVWICDPLRIAAATRDPAGNDWGYLLQWKDGDGRAHRWASPASMLAGDGQELRAVLLSRGLRITPTADRRLLTDYLQRSRPEVKARSVGRTGWSDGVFVWPDGAEGDTAAEPVVLQLASAEGVETGQSGTLDGWRQGVALPSAGNSRLVLAMSAAFAAPCLTLLHAEGGGLHLKGPSSVGKSTALRLAASVFGAPAYVRTWRATDNALEGIATLHNDLLLCLDELGELLAKVAGAVAYLLANGVGKGRLRSDASLRAAGRWRLLFLSSGEVGLADLIGEAGGKVRAGMEVRFLDVPADAGAGLGLFDAVPAGLTAGGFADSLTDAAGRHYGHAGRAWVRWLVQHHAEAREALRELRDAIAAELAPEGAAGQVRRVAQRFALVGAAGELASAAGLTGWPDGEASAAAMVCFRSWLQARGTAGSSEPAAMVRQVRQFLEQHGESRFTPLEGEAKRDTANRAGFRREAADGTQEFLILPEAFRGEVSKGFDFKAVADALAAAGALRCDAEGTRTRAVRLPGFGSPVRVYVVTAALWGATP